MSHSHSVALQNRDYDEDYEPGKMGGMVRPDRMGSMRGVPGGPGGPMQGMGRPDLMGLGPGGMPGMGQPGALSLEQRKVSMQRGGSLKPGQMPGEEAEGRRRWCSWGRGRQVRGVGARSPSKSTCVHAGGRPTPSASHSVCLAAPVARVHPRRAGMGMPGGMGPPGAMGGPHDAMGRMDSMGLGRMRARLWSSHVSPPASFLVDAKVGWHAA